MICFGPLVVLFCTAHTPPPVASDFCRLTQTEVQQVRHLTKQEIAVLQRPRKEALLSLQLKYEKLCH